MRHISTITILISLISQLKSLDSVISRLFYRLGHNKMVISLISQNDKSKLRIRRLWVRSAGKRQVAPPGAPISGG